MLIKFEDVYQKGRASGILSRPHEWIQHLRGFLGGRQKDQITRKDDDLRQGMDQ